METTAQQAIDQALISSDMSGLSEEQRRLYYRQVCESLGLNPLTQPFGYLVLNGKLRLYALKGRTDQLRALRRISIEILSMKVEQDLFLVHCRARDESGRVDEDVGFAPIINLKGEALGNAKLKAITKSKRRCTLSICGLGMLDESEVESIPAAKTYPADAVPVGSDADPLSVGEGTTRPPEPVQERLTQEAIDRLFELATAANELKEALGSRLRNLMRLSGDTRISKKFLREQMSQAQYDAARAYYERVIREQVEDDVPTHEPPALARQDDPEATQPPVGVMIAATPEGTTRGGPFRRVIVCYR